MAEDTPTSIADRIAALKLNQVGQRPGQPNSTPARNGQPPVSRTRPPPPPRPSLPARPEPQDRSKSMSGPATGAYAAPSIGDIGNLPERGDPESPVSQASRPALPPRTSTSSLQSPGLPPRRPSQSPGLPARRPSETPSESRRKSNFDLSRRSSNESVSSIATARSGTSMLSNENSVMSVQSDRYAVRAPSYDPSSLPALPAKLSQENKEGTFKKYNGVLVNRFPLKSMKSTPNIQQPQVGTTPPPPPRPSVQTAPALPQKADPGRDTNSASPQLPQRQPTLPPPPRKSALAFGMNKGDDTVPPLPSARPQHIPENANGMAPPPVPISSKPDLAALQASKPRLNGQAASGTTSSSGSCLLCRDFSGPDEHAARFPRESLPSFDIGWLAEQLTSPFPSPTDKARALFTWLHHNVSYDTVAFFNHNVKPSTPQSTLQSGLAVCEGYAGLFAALAMKAGLEAYVVGGHGKGFGYSKLQPGQPIPPYSAGHAWNVVKIDGGQWKLIDCCWGAGVVNGNGKPYQKLFSPSRFTQSNDDFGLDHYPGDPSKQFRNDGRTVTWEEYILANKNGCGADFFSGYIEGEGLSSKTFQPVSNPIVPAQHPGPIVRFSFQKKCPHWDPIRCGKGPYYVYVLILDALEGTGKNNIPFETNGDVWWCDVPVADLSHAGQEAKVFAITSFGGKDGRGLTVREYREKKGRAGFAMGGVCKWQIA